MPDNSAPRSAICDLPNAKDAWRRYMAYEVGTALLQYARGEPTPYPPAAYANFVTDLLDRDTPLPEIAVAGYVPPGDAADIIIAGLTR